MIVATELPVHYQSVLASLTDYDFCISSIYRKLPDYRDFYNQQRDAGHFVILDNGAFEEELLSVDELLDCVLELRPQEVVAPDVINDRQQTYLLTKEFIAKLEAVLWTPAACRPRPLVQACPQGKDFEEWIESYIELAMLDGVHVMGISYYSLFACDRDSSYFSTYIVAEEAVRLRFFHRLIGANHLRVDKPHHLLGLFSPAALRAYAGYPFIRSIDTSFPVICGLLGERMTTQSAKSSDRLDYECELSGTQLGTVIENILWMKKECQRG